MKTRKNFYLMFGFLCAGLAFPLAITAAPGNAIDAYLSGASRSKKLITVVDDLTFIRRVFLDLAGRLPTESETNAFLGDGSYAKRARLIDSVMETESYANRWAVFFDDLFWNQSLVPDSHYRNMFHAYLKDMLSRNVPWDEAARSLLTDSGNPDGGPSGTQFWLLYQFDQSFRLDFLDDQVGAISESMLGVQINCISCHDGAGHLEKVNKGLTPMKRDHFWGMAAFLSQSHFYAPRPARFYENINDFFRSYRYIDLDSDFSPGNGLFPFDRSRAPNGEYLAESEVGEGMRQPRSGGTIQPRYLFTGEGPLPGETRRQALARLITNDRQFARNMVNRVWAHFFGEGFVHPVNAWDLGRLNPNIAEAHQTDVQPRDYLLLEGLTDYFIGQGFDLKAMFRLIANSRAYQADYKNRPFTETSSGLDYWVSDRRISRIDAESIMDNIFQILEVEARYTVTGILDRTFSSAWELPDSSEPDPGALISVRAEQLADPVDLGYASEEEYEFMQSSALSLLTAFGRADRYQFEVRDNNGRTKTALSMMNDEGLYRAFFERGESPFAARLAAELAQGARSPDEIVRDLFLQILFREPSSKERDAFLGYLVDREPGLAVRDMIWVLFNHSDFIYK